MIVLNAAWSWAFFAAHAPGFGLVVILLLVAAIAATVALFLKVDRLAAGLMIPYLLWVLFATLLRLLNQDGAKFPPRRSPARPDERDPG